ncbi:MAG TPA: DUF3737 family protein [Tepiditoga sp.]|nr:DUF3737 family protein [Thermotogota bacterium]HOO74745.1 DUF3737 family protein [Tepiditoga sp.]
MKTIEKQIFEGERPLFKSSDILLKECEFIPGESALKECKNITVQNSKFDDNYPFWHNEKLEITDSYFSENCRAAIWYTKDIYIDNCKINGPKVLRESENINIKNSNGETSELLWECKNVNISDSKFKSDYIFLHSENIQLDNFELNGKYSFQYVKNSVLKNCTLKSKDCFWNSENVTVYDSVIEGEYLGWYSKNLKLINCTIIGTQPLCYAENLIMENCKMYDTDLCFEYTTLDAEITTSVDSIKNPTGGIIKAKSIKEIILDDNTVDHSKTIITTEE